LIFQDEMEIHRHPALTRMWAPVGQQPEVPAPGQNEKKVVYGGVDYKTGKLTYTAADTKSGTEFLAFLIALVARYAGRKILLVCDNGRFHTTKAVQLWLAEHRDQLEIFWLPHIHQASISSNASGATSGARSWRMCCLAALTSS
jgi:DDE superfamily endonuclease